MSPSWKSLRSLSALSDLVVDFSLSLHLPHPTTSPCTPGYYATLVVLFVLTFYGTPQVEPVTTTPVKSDSTPSVVFLVQTPFVLLTPKVPGSNFVRLLLKSYQVRGVPGLRVLSLTPTSTPNLSTGDHC